MKIDLKKKFPKKFFSIIKLIGEAADKAGVSAYIVGGPVRDALLKVKNYDLDFVIEGDAIKFAGDLNKRLKGDLKTHKTFGTATVSYEDIRVDIATARRETYKKPAAYPDVEPAAIKEDLFRRDFTINA
ncbi:MAG: polynucleotide adenylyltransferase, partial [Candidatus Omnitrophica bacterium]|nr:polynucleotide adenylyltransferase [Candidatus Omnitrophota bacterium]